MFVDSTMKASSNMKNAVYSVIFVSLPGQINMPRPLQQFQYWVMEAAFARDLCFHIVVPNLRISGNLWRPCETPYSAFSAKVSRALQAYIGYKGNSQMLIDEATAFDFSMQMAHRSKDENGVRQVSDLTAARKGKHVGLSLV